MFTIVIVGVTVLANILIATLVLKKNPHSDTNRLVAALSIVTALWTVFNYLALVPGTDAIMRLFWVRTVMLVTTPYGSIILLLAETFPEAEIPYSRKKMIGILLFNIITAAFAISPYMFTRVENTSATNFNLYPGWAIIFFAIAFMGFMTYGFIRLFKKNKTARGLLKSQLKLFATGLIISFTLLSLTNFVAVVVFRSIQLTSLGPPFTLIMFAFIIYAIVKHRFLDITAVVARAVTYTLTLLTIVGFEALVVVLGVKLLPEGVDKVWASAFGAILIVLGYDTLRNVFTAITERIFFQGRYDTEDVLAQLTRTMASVIDMSKLSEKLLTTLITDMRITQGAFILFTDGAVSHIESMNWPNVQTLRSADWGQVMNGRATHYVFEDMENGEMKDMFRTLGITLALPLRIKNDDIGILLLGPKASGDIYADRDLELLSIFAPQAAIAVNNAKAYHEIQKFSKTLEKKVEERTAELQSSQRGKLAKARELLKIKDEFVFIATHDLATPVTALRGFVQLLQEKTKQKFSKDVQFDIDSIGEATERLKTLVEDLLEVARGDSGTIKVELAKTDLAQVLTESEKLVHQRARSRKISFHITPAKSARYILADERKLREVIENLFTNAVKYNKDGGSVDVLTKIVGDKVLVTIADTGIGIPDKEQSKVFTKFYRSESDEARMQSGTGLGLFVVKMLVTKMKGTIDFVSTEGKGTTFTLTFAHAT